MIQYIDKNKVEEILRSLWKKDDGTSSKHRICYNKALQEVQCKLDTLKVKEVDCEKEFEKCCENYTFDDECEVYTARHFFELGLKAQKGE